MQRAVLKGHRFKWIVFLLAFTAMAPLVLPGVSPGRSHTDSGASAATPDSPASTRHCRNKTRYTTASRRRACRRNVRRRREAERRRVASDRQAEDETPSGLPGVSSPASVTATAGDPEGSETAAVTPRCELVEGDCGIYSDEFWGLLAKYERFEIATGVYPQHPPCMEAWERGIPIVCATVVVYLYPDGMFGIDPWVVDPEAPGGWRLWVPDDPPSAAEDAVTVSEDSGPGAIDVLANDPDSDGGPKSIDSVTQPGHGTVQITGGGTGLSYEPDAEYCNEPGGEPEEFEYTLAPGGSAASVAVTVSCVHDPVAVVYSSKYWELLAKYKRFEIAPGVYPYHPFCMEAWERGQSVFCISVIVYLYPDGTLGGSSWMVDPCAPEGWRFWEPNPPPC